MKKLIKSESEQLRKELQLMFDSQLVGLKDMQPDFIGWRDFKLDGSSLAYCSNSLYEHNSPSTQDTSFHYMQEILWLNRKGFKIIIRTPNTVKNEFLKKLDDMDMCNSIIIYKKDSDIIQMFCFIFKSSNLSTMNFFVNEKEKFEMVVNRCLKSTYNVSNNLKYLNLRKRLFSEEQAISLFSHDLLSTKEGLDFKLSPRQKQVLNLIVQDATNKDIANTLCITPKAVEFHFKNIRKTLCCHTRFDIKNKIIQKLI
jgi:DNA-binding CsgD family transcriptional regulator